MRTGERPIPTALYIADRATVDFAQDLIRTYGDEAGLEAASRAEHSRDVGNLARFCQWRQIERVIVMLSTDNVAGTIH